MSSTITQNPHTKTHNKNLQDAASSSKTTEEAIENIQKLDNKCTFTKCKAKTNLFAIECKHCKGRFCTSHGLPEVHGCGESIRREEKREYSHPEVKASKETHEKAKTKMAIKLKQMENERKSKQGFQNKGNKKK